jgi:hypothetical protein
MWWMYLPAVVQRQQQQQQEHHQHQHQHQHHRHQQQQQQQQHSSSNNRVCAGWVTGSCLKKSDILPASYQSGFFDTHSLALNSTGNGYTYI